MSCCIPLAHAQFADIEIKASINKPSITLGEELQYTITISYPKTYDVYFSDSTYFKNQIEFVDKHFSNTKWSDGLCKDSITYTIRYFGEDSTIELNAPIYLFKNSFQDTLFMHHDPLLVEIKNTPIPSNYQWLSSDHYKEVKRNTDYFKITLTALSSILILILFYFIAGKKLIRRIQLIRININHRNFLTLYDLQVKNFSVSKQRSDLETIINAWKAYISKLNDTNITSLTTTELSSITIMKDIVIALKKIDEFIYGGLNENESMSALSELKRFSHKLFILKKNELKNE
jgi:hypothetical protein